MSYNCKNYKADDGDTLVIGGKIVFKSGAEVDDDAGITNSPASATALGVVKIGDNISVTSAGVISVEEAGTAQKGVVQIGDNISVTSEGVISVPDADTETKGVVLQGVAVSDAAGEAPTAAEFKALLDSLRDAGIIAES